MQINIINGNPKIGESTSQLLISYIMSELSDQSVEVFDINKEPLAEDQISKIVISDVLIFVFPLYIDSIPSQLLDGMVKLAQHGFGGHSVKVYCIVNSAFFESKQNLIAIDYIKIWCEVTNLTWGQGISVSAGEMLSLIKNIPLGYGPNENLKKSIKALATNIVNNNSGDDIIISIDYPKLLWKMYFASLDATTCKKNNNVRKYYYIKKPDKVRIIK